MGDTMPGSHADAIAVRDAVPLVLVCEERAQDVDVYAMCCGDCLDSSRVCAGVGMLTDEHITYFN